MHLLEDGAHVDDLLAPYRDVDRVRPQGGAWVLANMVGGLDGTAAIGGRVGALTGGADAALFRRLRALADVVLVGAETVRAEGYGPVRLADDLVAERAAAGRPAVPPIVVVSGSLRLDWDGALFADADPESPTVVATTPEAARSTAGRLAEGHAELLCVEPGAGGGISVPALLGALAERGHEVVLCEGGPALLGELVDAGRLDELCLTVAPMIGGDPLPIVRTPAGAVLHHFVLRHVGADEGALFLRYEAVR